MIVGMKILALNSKLYNIFKVSAREGLHITTSLTLHLLLILSCNLHRKAKRAQGLFPLVSLMVMMDLVVYMIT
jgi:hypothetical protein